MALPTPAIYGMAAGVVIPGYQWTAWSDERGGWYAQDVFLTRQATLTLTAYRDTFHVGAKATDLNTNLDSVYSVFEARSVTTRHLPGSWAEVTVRYGAFLANTTADPTAAAVIPQYELRGSLTDRSLMEHPDVKALTGEDAYIMRLVNNSAGDFWRWDTSADALQTSYDGGLTWVDYPYQPSASGDAWVKLLLSGINTYLHPTFTWTERWSADEPISAARLNSLGKVDTPAGSAPSPGSGRDWMMSGAQYIQRGARYDNSRDWILSDEDGWGARYT